jgi:DNA polymerase III alpha subunit
LAALEEALTAAAKSRQRKQQNQTGSLFESFDPPPRRERPWPEATPLTEAERLKLERELLGFYVSGHPLDRYLTAMDAIRTCPLSETNRLPDKSRVLICGSIGKFQQRVGRNDQPFAFATLEDATGTTEIILWSNVLAKCGDCLELGRLVTVHGQVDNKGADEKYGVKVIASDVKDFERSLDYGLSSLTVYASLADLDGVVDLLAPRIRQRGIKKISPKSTSWQTPDPSLVNVFLAISDGLGHMVYRLDNKVRLSLDLFQELGRRLPLSGGRAITCSSSANPFGD